LQAGAAGAGCEAYCGIPLAAVFLKPQRKSGKGGLGLGDGGFRGSRSA
jgi:hypothetical protein